MKKIKGKTSLWEKGILKEEHQIKGCLLKDIVVYKENDVLVKVFLKEKEIKLTRSSEEYKIELFFEEKKKRKGNYLLKKENINLEIYTISKIKKKENNIEIKYKVYMKDEEINENTWKLKYEVIK